jgi:hypothetical protein
MEVNIKPERESRLTELASKSGRATDDLVEDAICIAMRAIRIFTISKVILTR